MRIEINQIKKSFGKQMVLNNISLVISTGKIFCLLGASGSGKTTLLRIMMGAISAEKGTVSIGGTIVPDRLLLGNIGYMPQNEALYGELSIWDNLKFFAGIHKLNSSAFVKNAEELLQIVDLSNERNKLIRNCSGGMKKRISLAAALIHHPKLLLLDEPTVGVDPVLRKKIWNYLEELKNNGTTIIVTTHVMDEVRECDNAALLRNGKIIATDTVENLISGTPNGRIDDLFFMDYIEAEKRLLC